MTSAILTMRASLDLSAIASIRARRLSALGSDMLSEFSRTISATRSPKLGSDAPVGRGGVFDHIVEKSGNHHVHVGVTRRIHYEIENFDEMIEIGLLRSALPPLVTVRLSGEQECLREPTKISNHDSSHHGLEMGRLQSSCELSR